MIHSTLNTYAHIMQSSRYCYKIKGGIMANKSTNDEEITLLKKLKEATLEKDIAEANAAKLKALIPSGETKPLEGAITRDEKSGFISDLAAYDIMTKITEQIAQHIKRELVNKPNLKILIVDSLDYCRVDVLLIQVRKQIKLYLEKMQSLSLELTKELKKREGQTKEKGHMEMAALPLTPALAALYAAPSILSLLADTAGYFRSNYDVKGREITQSETALKASLINRIKQNEIEIHLTNFHRIKDKDSDILEDLSSCIQERLELLLNLSKLDGITPNDKVDGNNVDNKVLHAELHAEVETLVKEFDEFNKALITVIEGQSISLLANVAVRDYAIKKGFTHLLYAAIVFSGGESITKRSIWSSGDTRFLGGSVVAFMLSDADTGEIICANTVIDMNSVNFNLGEKDAPKFSK